MLRTLLACAAFAAAVAPPAFAAGPAPGRATIAGVPTVKLRSGPAADAVPLASVREGTSVRVERRTGRWALVALANGDRGYVRVANLDMTADASAPGAAATPTAGLAGEEATVPPTSTPSPTAPPLDREIAALRERLASLEASVDRGNDAVAPPPVVVPTVVEPPASLEVGPALALAGVGFLAGFLVGIFYGQRQERNRRMRVRF